MASAMYFITEGSVEIYNEETDEIYATVSTGQFFGEVGVLHGLKRTASVRAATATCQILILTTEAIKKVSKEYPDTYKVIALEADRRLTLSRAREASQQSISTTELKAAASDRLYKNTSSGGSLTDSEQLGNVLIDDKTGKVHF
jgi:CRP-like cAMP-binding protein